MAEQINATVSFEVARKLAEAGYDQNQFPQMVWVVPRAKNYAGVWRLEYWEPGKESGSWIREWLAAPTHIQAFQFFEQEKGYGWGRDLEFGTWCGSDRPQEILSWAIGGLLDPDSLILAILEHLKEQRILDANPIQSRSVQRRLAAQGGR